MVCYGTVEKMDGVVVIVDMWGIRQASRRYERRVPTGWEGVTRDDLISGGGRV